jgi:hypothetical protein
MAVGWRYSAMTLLHDQPDFQTRLKLEADGTLVSKTLLNDHHIMESNQQHRNERVIVPGRNEAPLHPSGAKIIWWFQVHPVAWAEHKRNFPEIHADLHSGNQIRRERAAAKIAREHPRWVACAPRELRRVTSQQNPLEAFSGK